MDMPKAVTEYKLLISCPGDVKDEISVIMETINEFNDRFTDSLGIVLRPIHWSRNSFPQSGGKPQELLNQQFVKECDAAIAVMWTRFGTPTDDFGSGTEEEIEIMLEQGKQVFMYFSDCPISPSLMNSEGYKQVHAFRERYGSRGLYHVYSSVDEFKRALFAHLTQYFMVQLSENSKESCLPKLAIVGISESHSVESNVVRCSHIQSNPDIIDTLRSDIVSGIQEVNGFSFPTKEETIENEFLSPYNKMLLQLPKYPMRKPLFISEDNMELLRCYANEIDMLLSDDFFSLGELGTLPSFDVGGPSRHLDGTDDEIKKYKLIMNCISNIRNLTHIMDIYSAYNGLLFIELALTNTGNTFDEDVTVELEFPSGTLISREELKRVDDSTAEFIHSAQLYDVLFGIETSNGWDDYPDSLRPAFYPTPYGETDPQDTFTEEMDRLFAYQYYSESDKDIIKFDVPYIKQHTSVAFPSRLFVSIPTGKEHIHYKIISKHSPDVITGVFQIVASNE